MKHLIVCLICLSAIALSADAQTSKFGNVTWGPEITGPSKSTMSDMIASDDEGVYALRYKGALMGYPKMILEYYDPKMNLKKSTEINMTFKENKLDFEYALYSNGNLYLFGSYYNSKAKTNYLFYQQWNKKTHAPIGSMKKISETVSKSRYNRGSFEYDISPDKSKIIMLDLAAFLREDSEKFSVRALDENMIELWSKEVSLPYTDKLFRVQNFWVDNDGNFYMVGKHYFDKVAEKKKGEPNFNYVVVTYKNEGTVESKATISLGDYFITDLQVAPRTDGSVFCAGFYSEKGTRTIKGSYGMNINPETGAVSNKQLKEFEKEFLTLFMSEKKAEKGKELFEFDLDDIVMYEDGSSTLIAEQYYVKVVTTTTSNPQGGTSTRTTYYYYYNDIIAVHYDANNNIVWKSKVPKRQVTTNDGGYFSSYFAVTDKDKNIYFVFNDNPKNITIKEGDKLFNYNRKESVINLLRLDANGEWEKSILAKNKEFDMITRPKVAKLVNENEALIYSEWRKSYRLGKLSFKG